MERRHTEIGDLDQSGPPFRVQSDTQIRHPTICQGYAVTQKSRTAFSGECAIFTSGVQSTWGTWQASWHGWQDASC
ncbi:hypothetical protein R1flu_012973 [Riccia fluitans]|uniref:Uncharacterized protein n=1 Tax=Riccia fluitans TaxID=41844 RepID=A0ABD1ZCA8_9MARC